MIDKLVKSKFFWPAIWGISFLVSFFYQKIFFKALGSTVGFVGFPFISIYLYVWISGNKDGKESKKTRFRRLFLYSWGILTIGVVYGWTL